MSSSFLKTSPYSSSYGLYGAGTVNPYASYFGPPPSHPNPQTQNQNPGQNPGQTQQQQVTSMSTPPSTSFSFGSSLAQGPSGGFNTNPTVPGGGGGGGGGQVAAAATSNSPYFGTSSYTSPIGLGPTMTRPGIGISGGSPPYFSPQPAQTRIIGGVASSGAGTVPVSGRMVGHLPATSSSPSNLWGFGSPSAAGGGRSIDDPSHPQHHEPMHYSPTHTGSSPTSNSTSTSGSSPYGVHHLGGQHMYPQQSHPNTVYLPCYFLGLDQPHHYQGGGGGGSPPSPGSSGGGGGGGGSGTMGSMGRVGGPGAFMSPPGSGRNIRRTVLFEPKSFPETDVSGGEDSRQPVKKLNGPPIHGFGSSEGASAKDFLEAVIRTEGTPNNNFSSSLSTPPLFGSGHSANSTTFSPGGNSMSTSSSKCWVTIFGFPAGASSFIVTNFSTLGKIMEIKCTPGSNWLHIRFSDPIEARRALSRNGKVLGQSIMVGVIPSDAKVIEEAQKANVSNPEIGRPNQHKSPAPSPILRERNVDGSSTAGASLKSRIRPLASGYNYNSQQMSSKMVSPPRSVPGAHSTARDTFAVGRGNHDGVPVPTPSTGIVTKTLEFFFGW